MVTIAWSTAFPGAQGTAFSSYLPGVRLGTKMWYCASPSLPCTWSACCTASIPLMNSCIPKSSVPSFSTQKADIYAATTRVSDSDSSNPLGGCRMTTSGPWVAIRPAFSNSSPLFSPKDGTIRTMSIRTMQAGLKPFISPLPRQTRSSKSHKRKTVYRISGQIDLKKKRKTGVLNILVHQPWSTRFACSSCASLAPTRSLFNRPPAWDHPSNRSACSKWHGGQNQDMGQTHFVYAEVCTKKLSRFLGPW